MKFKKTRQFFTAITMIVVMAAFAACAPQGEGVVDDTTAMGAITIVDREGVETVLDSVPMSVVSVSPAITETLAVVAGLDVIVGRTTYCDYPEGVEAIEEIGDLYAPNIEKIIAMNPDVVLLSAHTNPDVAKAMREAGVKVIRVYEEDKFEGGYQMVEVIGKIMGMEDKADGLVADMQEQVAAVEEKIQNLPAKTVYYMSSAGEYGDYAATGDTYVGAMLERAGGTNVAQDGVKWAFSLEALLEADPDIIITSSLTGYKSMLPKMEGYKDLTAVKEGRVIEIDTNPIDRIGVRFAEGFALLAQLIHPEAFE